MKWKVLVRPAVELDVTEAADWYDSKQPDLVAEFREEVIRVFDALVENLMLNCRRHPSKNIRWRYPKRFPYRVVYEVIESEQTVIVAAVLHAARHDHQWRRRM